MKRIEAFIQSDKLDSVIEAVEKQGAGGITILQARGRGKGDRPMVGGARGTGRHVAQFNTLDAIITVVDDSKVNPVIEAITKFAGTGSKGDGKIFVSSIDEAIDIGSNKKGQEAL